MTNLGAKESTESYPTPVKSGSKISYPSLCIRDKSLEAAFGKELPEVGEELEATLTLKVVGTRNDQYGKSVEFEVIAGDFSDPEMKDGKPEKPEPEEKGGGMGGESSDD